MSVYQKLRSASRRLTVRKRSHSESIYSSTSANSISGQLQHEGGEITLEYIKASAQLPEGRTINEWLALHTVDFYNQINLIYALLSEFCTAETCPSMTAGDTFEYYWADESGSAEPVKVSAPEYVENLLAWIAEQLNDPVLFPPEEYSLEYPPMFSLIVKTICRRLFRVFAHMYCSHLDSIITIGLLSALNNRFRHFICFVVQFDLVDRHQLLLLKDVIEEMLDIRIFDRRALYQQQTIYGMKPKRSGGDTVVFGVALAEVVEREKVFDGNLRNVPMIVYKCIEHLEKIEGYQREGIFRKSAGVHKINKLKALFDEDSAKINLETQEFSYDIHAVACLLKLYFRELPEPLLLNENYEKWLNACKFEEEPRRLLEIKYLLKTLPVPNYQTTKVMIQFLKKVGDYSFLNKMSPDNLAIVLCPVFLWDKKSNSSAMLSEAADCAVVIEAMIRHAESLFPEDEDEVMHFVEQPETPISGSNGTGGSNEAEDDGDGDDGDEARKNNLNIEKQHNQQQLTEKLNLSTNESNKLLSVTKPGKPSSPPRRPLSIVV